MGEEGEGDVYEESNMKTYITTCKIDRSQWDFGIWFKELKEGLCINLEGWDGEGDGGEVEEGGVYIYLWLIHVDICRKQQDSVSNYPSIKNKFLKKNPPSNARSTSPIPGWESHIPRRVASK